MYELSEIEIKGSHNVQAKRKVRKSRGERKEGGFARGNRIFSH